MKLQDNKIYLASKSPRRRELLRQIGVQFEILLLRDGSARPTDVSEEVLPNEAPLAYVQRVTNEKVAAAWNMMLMRKLPIRPVLAADTTVVLNDTIFGKPGNRSEALAMLSSLSGQTHEVLTCIAVHFHELQLSCIQTSHVTLDQVSTEQIAQYCDTQEPYDKAGGYGIQGTAARFIKHIDGSYSGIMGLPLFETTQLLNQVGFAIP